jgi:hypothetical protein
MNRGALLIRFPVPEECIGKYNKLCSDPCILCGRKKYLGYINNFFIICEGGCFPDQPDLKITVSHSGKDNEEYCSEVEFIEKISSALHVTMIGSKVLPSKPVEVKLFPCRVNETYSEVGDFFLVFKI